MEIPLISRAEAVAKGLKKYFTGKPCPKGHVAERHVTRNSCSECAGEKAKKWRTANKERVAENARKRSVVNRVKIAAIQKVWYEENRERVMALQRERRYGHPDVFFHQILTDQAGGCALCKKNISFKCVKGKQVTAHIDHCHSTGNVRGILCKVCNTSLGGLGDNIPGLKRALAYLEKSEQTRQIVTQDQPLTPINQ